MANTKVWINQELFQDCKFKLQDEQQKMSFNFLCGKLCQLFIKDCQELSKHDYLASRYYNQEQEIVKNLRFNPEIYRDFCQFKIKCNQTFQSPRQVLNALLYKYVIGEIEFNREGELDWIGKAV